MMNVSYDYYRIFYYVGKYKSFSTAAKMLGSNQPNITKVMNKLEQQTGCILFVRSNKGISLTAEGRLLYEHVRIAYEQLRIAENELEKALGFENGIVNIGASENALHGILLSVLKDFHKKYPRVHIHLLNFNTPQALYALKQNLIDFCVISSPFDVPKDCCVTDIMEFSEKLVASKAFMYKGKEDGLTIEGLTEYSLVALDEGTGTYEYYNRLFAEYGCRFLPDIQVATSDLLLPLIENNLGIGFVPEFMLGDKYRRGKIKQLQVKTDMPVRKICLVESNDKICGIAANTLKKMILGQAENPDSKTSAVHRGRYNEQGNNNSDIYEISKKAEEHIKQLKKEERK